MICLPSKSMIIYKETFHLIELPDTCRNKKAVKDEATNETYFPTWNEMQVGWGPKVATASMVPNVTIMLLNAIFGHHFRTQPRLLVRCGH